LPRIILPMQSNLNPPRDLQRQSVVLMHARAHFTV
jgi:hypothetical protein